MKYKFLSHTADIKFQAFGDSLEQVFSNSASALTNIISKDEVKNKINKIFEVSGKDKEALLYNFLEEFLFLFDSENFLLSNTNKIKIKEKTGKYELKAEISGDKAENYEIETHVKAVTYNDMFVKEEKNKKAKYKYTVQVVVDV